MGVGWTDGEGTEVIGVVGTMLYESFSLTKKKAVKSPCLVEPCCFMCDLVAIQSLTSQTKHRLERKGQMERGR